MTSWGPWLFDVFFGGCTTSYGWIIWGSTLPTDIGILVRYYKDPYKPIKISWNVIHGSCCRCLAGKSGWLWLWFWLVIFMPPPQKKCGTTIYYFEITVSIPRLQICPRNTCPETNRYRWHQTGSKYSLIQGLPDLIQGQIYNPVVDS